MNVTGSLLITDLDCEILSTFPTIISRAVRWSSSMASKRKVVEEGKGKVVEEGKGPAAKMNKTATDWGATEWGRGLAGLKLSSWNVDGGSG